MRRIQNTSESSVRKDQVADWSKSVQLEMTMTRVPHSTALSADLGIEG